LIEAAILAVIVAPTDAALGKPVVTNTKVPEKIRESLNIESGLNDGLCVPFLLLFFALSKESITGQEILLNVYFIKTIGIGAISGLGLAYIGFYLFKKAIRSGWIGASWYRILVITLAISIFSLAQFLGGSGFIACFSGGVLFGYLTRNHKQKLELAAEGTGDTMSLITWVLFGATIVPIFIKEFEFLMVVYAILSLTIIRMIPVSISLIGLKLNFKTQLFLGWFGPRGLASIVFIFMVMEQNLPHQKLIALVGVCTIILSVIMHGLSANPIVKRFVRSQSKS
jgi:NhaP-type Na+/H+ or K+/H+ antiporter